VSDFVISRFNAVLFVFTVLFFSVCGYSIHQIITSNMTHTQLTEVCLSNGFPQFTRAEYSMGYCVGQKEGTSFVVPVESFFEADQNG